MLAILLGLLVHPAAGQGTDSEQQLFFAPAPDQGHSVSYDAKTQKYTVRQKVGNLTIGQPQIMSTEEYQDFRREQSMRSYWANKRRGLDEDQTAGGSLLPTLNVGGEGFDRIFGSNTIEIVPQGSAELLFGITHSKTDNYTIPEDMRSNTAFDFNTKLQVNLSGRIGTKLRMDVKYDTESTFNYENNVHIIYTGTEDEIIQRIEAGNVALDLPGSLITGSQSLFGFRTDLKFGRLYIQTVLSQRKGQSQSIEVKGGAQTKLFELRADEYEANRHFFLSQYFRASYNQALSQLPLVLSGVEITRTEVWVTNKRGKFDNSRDFVAFVDLGETAGHIFAQGLFPPNPAVALPSNEANTLYAEMVARPSLRSLPDVTSTLAPLQPQNFRNGQDYEKLESARLLSKEEYTVNQKLGFISLKQALNADEILAVAFEYTLGGKTYQVGEFSTDGVEAPKALILKLIKGTDLAPTMPTWRLMMKNIYPLGDYRIDGAHFEMDVLYQDDDIGTPVNYLSEGDVKNQPLLSVLNLDNLNPQGDAGPDGIFDFVEGITVLAASGHLIFPELEPFGDYLAQKINDPAVAKRIAYTELYDSTLTVARQMAQKNKFILKGEYRGANTSEIPLNAPNVPKGSVVVTAGGKKLVENTDYVVDYVLGSVRIINQGLLESGTPIKISLESNLGIDFQVKTLMGTHWDYRFNDRFNLGATVLNLSERPMTKKVTYGSESLNNTIWGLNTAYQTEVPWLTRAVDYIPLIDTKEKSRFTASAEFAQLIPGRSRHLDKRAAVYLDDFEANKSLIDLRMWSSWAIASTPQGNPEFPEGELSDDLRYGMNRARIAWYTIDPLFQKNGENTPRHIRSNADYQSSHYVREVEEKEIFPNRKKDGGGAPVTLPVLNVAYYPSERGPYNFDADAVNPDGTLANPQSRWGGIMRDLPITDFERSNIEYVEFWLMDPFAEDPAADGGDLILDLGNISEDILRDGRKLYENGLPVDGDASKVYESKWGRSPVAQSSVMAFDNDKDARQAQDVGLDGTSSQDEKSYFADYLARLQAKLTPEAYQRAEADPSSDDFHYFRGTDYDQQQLPILDRYKYFNNTEGNSPTAEQSPEAYPTSATSTPDVEDLNRDNTLSDNESYYQYRISLRPRDIAVGRNYIADKITVDATFPNGKESQVTWYQFKVPVHDFKRRVGYIRNFKSMRFMRMMLKGFDRPVVLRFATLGLVRGEWRRYNMSLLEAQENLGGGASVPTVFDISAVNIEENANRKPVNYVLPPNVSREIDASSQILENELNEQAMELKVQNLQDGDARAAYRNVSYDLRQYKRIAMDIHAEEIPGQPLKDGQLTAFLRIGSDYTSNYYEYEVPLTLTPEGFYSNSSDRDRKTVWPDDNAISIDMALLRGVKLARDDARRASGNALSVSAPYTEEHDGRRVTVVGYPSMAKVRVLMVGVRNPKLPRPADDGAPKSGIIWVNELRLSSIANKGGWSAIASVNTQMADFANLSLGGRIETPGFGSLESRIGDRAKETTYQYDAAANLALGKFFPKQWGVSLPLYLGFGETYKNPQYNPLDEDVPFDEALEHLHGQEKDSLRGIAQDFERRKSLNVTNVQVDPQRKDGSGLYPWDAKNFTASYAYTETNAHNVKTEYRDHVTHRGAIGYQYNAPAPSIQPFRNVGWMQSEYLALIRDFNFSPFPKQYTFQTDMTRSYLEQKRRNLRSPLLQLRPTYAKSFEWNRSYGLQWDLMRNLKLEFTANNLATIDEPEGPSSLPGDPSVRQNWRDTVLRSLSRFGRNKRYNQHLGVTYRVPVDKLPLLSWLTANASYSADYRWDAAPKLPKGSTIEVGNTIQNSNTIKLDARANLVAIYNKIPYFRRINGDFERLANGKSLSEKPEYDTVVYQKGGINLAAGKRRSINHNLNTREVTVVVYDADGREVPVTVDVSSARRIRITSETRQRGARVEVKGVRLRSSFTPSRAGDLLARLALSVRTVSASYSETNGTLLPGYLPGTVIFGNSRRGGYFAPGAPFVIGWQDRFFAAKAAERGWLTSDTTMVNPYKYTHSATWSYRVSIEPFPYVRLELSGSRTLSRNRTEFYRQLSDGQFHALNPRVGGAFSISTILIPTAFQTSSRENAYISEPFQQFSDNRLAVAERRATQRAQGGVYRMTPRPGGSGFPDGYGPLAQEVLVPSLLAAYQGRSASSVSLTRFPIIPLPNWQLTYDGLSRMEAIKPHIKQLTLRHGYKASYTIGAYHSAEDYLPGPDGYSYQRNKQDDFTPEYIMDNVSLSESFSPLFGVDLTFVSSLNTRFEVRKNRSLSMSFANNQMVDQDTWEYVLGLGYRFGELPLLMKNELGGARVVKSELRLSADFSIRKTQSVLRKLEERTNTPTTGQWGYSLKFAADYLLTSQITLRAFYDRLVTNPLVSLAYPTTTNSFGVSLKFTLDK